MSSSDGCGRPNDHRRAAALSAHLDMTGWFGGRRLPNCSTARARRGMRRVSAREIREFEVRPGRLMDSSAPPRYPASGFLDLVGQISGMRMAEAGSPLGAGWRLNRAARLGGSQLEHLASNRMADLMCIAPAGPRRPRVHLVTKIGAISPAGAVRTRPRAGVHHNLVPAVPW